MSQVSITLPDPPERLSHDVGWHSQEVLHDIQEKEECKTDLKYERVQQVAN
jgi:hypothetical protein